MIASIVMVIAMISKRNIVAMVAAVAICLSMAAGVFCATLIVLAKRGLRKGLYGKGWRPMFYTLLTIDDGEFGVRHALSYVIMLVIACVCVCTDLGFIALYISLFIDRGFDISSAFVAVTLIELAQLAIFKIIKFDPRQAVDIFTLL